MGLHHRGRRVSAVTSHLRLAAGRKVRLVVVPGGQPDRAAIRDGNAALSVAIGALWDDRSGAAENTEVTA